VDIYNMLYNPVGFSQYPPDISWEATQRENSPLPPPLYPENVEFAQHLNL
ncbi:uncharacterized protein METZ01_LOCUS257539, partial [marine metagenome]